MSYFEGHWKIKGTVLSPVHIGCDEVLDPFSIYYRPDGEELFQINLSDALANLPSEKREIVLKEVLNCSDAVSAIRLRKVLQTNLGVNRYAIADRAIKVSDKIAARFGDEFLNESLNSEFHLTAFNALSRQRIVPGSNLKGSIRTARTAVSAQSQQPDKEAFDSLKEHIRKVGRSQKVEEEFRLLSERVHSETMHKALHYSEVENDPFGELYISDCKVHFSETRFVSPLRYSIGRTKPMTFTEYVEVIEPSDRVQFEGDFRIVRRRQEGLVSNCIGLKEMVAACNRFAESTIRSFKQNSSFVDPDVRNQANVQFAKLLKQIESARQNTIGSPEKNTAIVLLGRFTGMLGKTLPEHRVMLRGKNELEIVHGEDAVPKTWVLDDIGRPFGFVKLEFEELPK